MIEISEDCPTVAVGEDGQSPIKLIIKFSLLRSFVPDRRSFMRSLVGSNNMFHYVYLIRSIQYPKTVYVGYTTNVKERLATHNSGGSIHTKKDRPWELVVCMAFKEMDCAKQFEKYLKSQSGRAFAKKRFW